MIYETATEAAWEMFDPACDYEGSYADFARDFATGAEWYAAGMAVCAFLDDLAHVYNEERCRHGRPRWQPGVNVRDACEDCWNELPF